MSWFKWAVFQVDWDDDATPVRSVLIGDADALRASIVDESPTAYLTNARNNIGLLLADEPDNITLLSAKASLDTLDGIIAALKVGRLKRLPNSRRRSPDTPRHPFE